MHLGIGVATMCLLPGSQATTRLFLVFDIRINRQVSHLQQIQLLPPFALMHHATAPVPPDFEVEAEFVAPLVPE